MEVDSGNEGISKANPIKKKKPGIIYLGTLPPFMNVTKVKDIFSSYGELGRIFLQPADVKPGKSILEISHMLLYILLLLRLIF